MPCTISEGTNVTATGFKKDGKIREIKIQLYNKKLIFINGLKDIEKFFENLIEGCKKEIAEPSN